MWLILKDNYLFNMKQTNDQFFFNVTNLINMWHCQLELFDLIKRFQNLNPMFEMKENAIIDKITDLFYLQSNEGCHKVEKLLDGNIQVNSSNAIKGFSYKMELVLQPASDDTFCSEFTAPLINLLSNFKEREKRLVTIIEAKDAELEEYRLEGVEIKRRNLITTPFSYETFSKSEMSIEVGNPIDLLRGPLQELLGVPTTPPQAVTEKTVPFVVKKGPTRAVADSKSISGTAGCLYSDKSDPVKNENRRKRKIPTRTLKL